MKVKFLPKKDIEVEVCNIYENRDAVIIQHTDTLLENTAYNVEALGFKFGIKPTSFHWPYGGIQTELSDIANIGVMKFGVYIPTDRYRTLSTQGYLPDYASDVVTQSGVNFYGRTLGEPKQTSYPNQGQQLYDFSFGSKGYDIINSIAGLDNNSGYTNELDYIDNWYFKNFNRFPSSGSDRQGRIGSKEIYMPYYLGIRKTQPNNSLENHEYKNIDRLGFIHKDITSRWENGFGKENMNVENNLLISSINRAFDANGLSNDFVHWHRAISHGGNIFLLHDLYELIYNTVGSRNAWYTGYSEAVEYYWYKKMVKRVRGSFIDNKLYLIADFDDEFFNEKIAGIDKRLLYNRIRQPLSVNIDLTGTIFENKDISGSGIINLGNNKFIIDIPFKVIGNELQQVVISETTLPKYKSFIKPSVLDYTNGIITTDLPCKAVMYSGDFTETMTVLERYNNYSLTHNFTNLTGAKIGLITEFGATILYEI